MATSKGSKTKGSKADTQVARERELDATPDVGQSTSSFSPRGRTDTADAFMPDPGEGPARIRDDLAEVLAEDFVRSATSGEDVDDEVMEQVVPEEYGGPFVESSADEEFAEGTDESNPVDALPEPLPRAVHGLSTRQRS